MSPLRSKPRLAALCVSLALLSASVWAQTSPAVAPAQAPATKGPTTIDAERIEGVSGIEVTASGRAEIRRDDMTIFGETLRLNRETGLIQGEGL
jgi:lipopolysaccharide assembly outer membrane protein LptD (OstA)